MPRPSIRSLVVFPVLATVLLATGCSASGGGTISPLTSAPCAPGAMTTRLSSTPTFGFRATLDPTTLVSTFSGNFTDTCAGVTLTGTGRLQPAPAPPDAPPTIGGCLAGLPSYTSLDPRKKGSGTFELIACDTGLQASPGQSTDGDLVEIAVFDGPYAGYGFSGVIQHGNIVVLS